MKYLLLIFIFQFSLQGFSQNDSLGNTISETDILSFLESYSSIEVMERCPCKIPATNMYFDSVSTDSIHKEIKYEWFLKHVYQFLEVRAIIDSNDINYFKKQIVNPVINSWNEKIMPCKLWNKRNGKRYCSPVLSIPLFSLDKKTVLIYSGYPTRWSIWHLNPKTNFWERVTGHQEGT